MQHPECYIKKWYLPIWKQDYLLCDLKVCRYKGCVIVIPQAIKLFLSYLTILTLTFWKDLSNLTHVGFMLPEAHKLSWKVPCFLWICSVRLQMHFEILDSVSVGTYHWKLSCCHLMKTVLHVIVSHPFCGQLLP